MKKRATQFILLCVLLLGISAGVEAQSAGKKISLIVNKVALPAALSKVEQQSGYYKINYSYDELSRYTVSANVKNKPAIEAVNALLGNLPYVATVEGRYIQIKRDNTQRAAVNAQQRKGVTGHITDENGEPMIGARVIVPGTQKMAVTDLDGNFFLADATPDDYIEVSYIGKKTIRRKAGSKPLNVIVSDDVNLMDEVVVTGYQNIKRENATGSYQLITADKLDERYTGTIVENLEGQIHGLMSYNNGLNGGGESSITIRGAGSFQARTNPLVVVDGLPIEGSIETINPYEIENITVLKDAAAAAIYGARASNGVIVVITKRAHKEKLEVDFSTDITISEKQDYDNYGWANSAQLIELERYNFNAMKSDKDQTSFNSVLERYSIHPYNLSLPSRLLVSNYLGEISSADMENQLSQLARKDYRKEWQDVYEREKVMQQYNLSLRTKGKYLNSSIVVNYKGDNLGRVKEHDNILTFSYRGDLDATKWLQLSFGTNIISERAKIHANEDGINGMSPYYSMYDENGNPATIYSGAGLDLPAYKNESYGLKDPGFSPIAELNMNFMNSRNTNIRTFASATATILPGWTASAHFQFEDIYRESNTYLEAESSRIRSLYNYYTGLVDGKAVHYIPEGGQLITTTNKGSHYTFRAQTGYTQTFNKKHAVEALAGFEFRQLNTKSNGNLLMGYDDITQTNRNTLVDWPQLKDLWGTVSILGEGYTMSGAPEASSFNTSDVLHRFYSLYFTGNYTYDSRYSASVSYRVDKTDLFGADPKFRGRPLWSLGASWNVHNEAFMKDYSWVDALKLRTSYGLTGNIDSNVSSYLTATLANEFIYGHMGASLDTPPNDQLRWEKTASWNVGVDFSFWNNRLSGSLDYYLKKGSDLLSVTDLDPISGWSQLTINNGKMTNKGIELQLNGQIIKPSQQDGFGLNASFNIAFNRNKVTKVDHEYKTGYDILQPGALKEGNPVHSLYAFRYGGITVDEEKNSQYINWYDAKGEAHVSDVGVNDFQVEDAVYCGSLDPKVMSGFTPEITYKGFSLSAMFSYYGGHYMRAHVEDWSKGIGNTYGYTYSLVGLSLLQVPASALNYWKSGSKTEYLANGYLSGNNTVGSPQYMDMLVVPADYMKLRNIVLGYNFPKAWCNKLGMNAIRLRVQVNNICTWVKNDFDVDPEANNPVTGLNMDKKPRSYTMSLHVNF